MNRVKALLDWAEGSSGRGIDEIWHYLEQATSDFEGYLTSLIATYEKWWTYYTLTDATGKIEPPPIFDLGLMVQTVEKVAPDQAVNPSQEERKKADFSQEERQKQEQREKIERLPVLEGIRKYAEGHVLLVGRPGSGKSTALIRLLLEEATAITPKSSTALSPSPSPKSGRGGPEKIPALVELRYWQDSIEGLMQGFLKCHGLMLDDSTLSTLLGEGRFLLLIDGLNELSSESARTELSAFRRNHPKLPMIFTTRDLGLGGDLGIEKKLEMQPLTEAQMKSFIRAYVPDHAEAMLRQLSDRLREFGQTPLLLWMLCQLFQQTAKIPENLGMVFRLFTQQYEGKLKSDAVIESDRGWWNPVLRQLAWVMMQGKTPTDFRVAIPHEEAVRAIADFLEEKVPYAEDFALKCLRDLQKHHLIQSEAGSREIAFRHQLIQEYYAAECLLRFLPKLSDEQLKRDYLNLLKWTEPIALMLALVDEAEQALRVVKLAIDDVDLILGANLAGTLQPNFQRQIINEITRFSPASENLKVELLGFTRSNFAIPHLLPYLGIDDFDLQYTLNRALERINSEDLVAALTKTISDKNPMTRIASIAALTNTPSQEAVRALRKALRHESPKTRWSAVAALGNVGSLEAEEDLLLALSDPSPNVVRQAAIALGKLASEKTVHFIFEKLQESSSIDGISFAHALASIGGEKVITALIKLYLEGDRLDFIIPAIEQAEIPQEAISIILEALNLEYTSAQINAIIAIGELELKLAVPHLMVLAHSEDYEIQGAVIEALGKLKAFEAKDLLIEKLEGKNYWTVTKAAVAVGRLNAKEAIPKLKSLLYDKKNHVREDILYALSLMNDMEAWSGILDMLEDENVHTRRIAISTLKSSNHEEVANDSRLLLILRSENNELTLADALEILGTSKFDSKFSVLESFLEHPDSIVRRGAINGLRTSSERKAVNLLKEKVLCELIDDSVVLDNDDLTFVEAAHAIGEIGDSEDLPFLIQILKKTSTEYFLEAILNI
ncbi:MAG: HEAT repeat domain-containing protein, partial [Nodosilinea sp.]